MTFTPSVQSKVDANNSTSVQLLLNGTFTGVSTATTGYDTLIVTVTTDVNSSAGGLEIQFSDDNVTFATFATDTVLATGAFTRTYLIIKKWYRVKYTTTSATATLKLTTRISTNLDSSLSSASSSANVFDNAVQASIDAFGKARVSTPSTLLDIRFPALSSAPPAIRENQQQVNLVVTLNYGWGASGDGTMQLLTLPPAANPYGYALTQSKTFVTYQPGKSLLMLFSGVFQPANSTYTSYIGLYDLTFSVGPSTAVPCTGVFLSFVSGVAAVNIANGGSITAIPQSSWNVDKMDGSGPSGLTLDFSKTQLFMIDLEWLGVGRVRFGFYAYGTVQYCHQVVNLNVLTAPYTQTMNLPVTYLLSGTATSTGNASLTQICSTVISEGGYNPVGRPFSANTGFDATTQQALVNTTETPILAIRGRVSGGYYHQTIVPTNLTIIDTDQNNTVLVRLRYYRGQVASNVTAVTWAAVSTTFSLVEYAARTVGGVTNLTFVDTGSIVVNSEYILGKGSNLSSNLATTFTSLLLSVTADASNTPDVLLLTAQRVGTGATTAKVWASMDWQEVY